MLTCLSLKPTPVKALLSGKLMNCMQRNRAYEDTWNQLHLAIHSRGSIKGSTIGTLPFVTPPPGQHYYNSVRNASC